MTPQALDQILTRATSDPDFAELLFDDLANAISDYDLTAEEIAGLQAIFHRGFDQWLEAKREADRRAMQSPDTPFD